jgi:protoheme IX farnesyltransferase
MSKSLCRLLRWRLSLLNGIVALGGFFLFPAAEIAPVPLAAVLLGVTLLAAAGSAFNQVQEREIDRLMERTRDRPIPCGDLTPTGASAIGAVCLLAGLLALGLGGGLLPVLLGIAALVWYLGVYTPLKRRTPFALAAGGLCGALPPVIGWVSAGGEPTDYRVMLLAGLLYLWQVPHFWLLQHRHAEDYRRAGLPLFNPRLNGISLFGLWRIWIMALVASALLLPAFGLIGNTVAPWYAATVLLLGLLVLSRSETILSAGLYCFPLLVTLALFF